MDLQTRIRARIFEVVARAREAFPSYAFAPYPEIRFTDDPGKTLGSAAAGCKLTINLHAARRDPNECMYQTIPHEVAHLVCQFDPTLGKNHDYKWSYVCRRLGGDGAKYFYLADGSTPARAKRKTLQYRYKADCGTELWIGAGRHRKILSGATYRVRTTKGQIAKAGYTGDSRVKS